MSTPLRSLFPDAAETPVDDLPPADSRQRTSDSDILLDFLSGTPVYAPDPLTDTIADSRLTVVDARPVIIGRSQGEDVPYLASAYHATNYVPGTCQNIQPPSRSDRNQFVSRAHFMLRCGLAGIQFINGVPGPDGRLRPPRNGTRLAYPERRALLACEQIWIPLGSRIVIVLPNDAEVKISAE